LVVENDNRGLLIEMARIRKDITGLPCDIYVDNGPIHSGHEGSPHIKFPPNNECKYSTEFASMSISANPDFFPDNKAKFDSIVKAKLKRKVQVFIINHLEDFILHFNGKISIEELKDRLRK
jgi:hypothetical protein